MPRGTTQWRTLRLGNSGGTTLTTTISKPPVAGPLAAVNPLGALAEGSTIPVGSHRDAAVYCAPAKAQVNVDTELLAAVWTLNTDDAAFGKRTVRLACSAVTRQVGPRDAAGQAYFRYLGCFRDADPVRRMDWIAYSSPNTHARCFAACSAANKPYVFAATQLETECWCGSRSPPCRADVARCAFLCGGDYNEYVRCTPSHLSTLPLPLPFLTRPALSRLSIHGPHCLGYISPLSFPALSLPALSYPLFTRSLPALPARLFLTRPTLSRPFHFLLALSSSFLSRPSLISRFFRASHPLLSLPPPPSSLPFPFLNIHSPPSPLSSARPPWTGAG